MQQKGDTLDARIRKAEKEVKALEATLVKMNGKNNDFRASTRKASDEGDLLATRAALREKLDAAYEKMKAAKDEETALRGTSIDTTSGSTRFTTKPERLNGSLDHLETLAGTSLQHLEVPGLRRVRARPLAQRAAVRAHPPQQFEVPVFRRFRTRVLVPRTAFARIHCSTSRCPACAASEHVLSPNGQPFARIHRNNSRCPFFAASALVYWSTNSFRAHPLQHLEVPGLRRVRARPLAQRAAVRAHPPQQFEVPVFRRFRTRVLVPRTAFARIHCSTSRCPAIAAALTHVSVSHGQPFTRAHCNTSR